MARARRAKARPARIVVPVAIAALILGGVVLASTRHWFTSGAATTTSSPSVLASEQAVSPSATSPTATGSSSASATPSLSATPSASSSSSSSPSPSSSASSSDASRALADCRTNVLARDAVLSAAQTGVEHWSQHVAAQTAANSGDISVDTMNAIFKRTRLTGPSDLDRYDKALEQTHKQSGSCAAPSGSPKSIRHAMARCLERSRDQQPVLQAASDGMADWRSHLAAMQRSRMGHVHDAQGVWLRAWRAAPPHIQAFQAAESAFRDAPSC